MRKQLKRILYEITVFTVFWWMVCVLWLGIAIYTGHVL